MWKSVFIVFFALASLLIQVHSAYACAFSGQTTSDCCCPTANDDGPCTTADRCQYMPASGEETPCCTQISAATGLFVTEAAGPASLQTFSPDPQPSPTGIVVNAWSIPALLTPAHTSPNTLPHWSYASKTYLRTERLRI